MKRKFLSVIFFLIVMIVNAQPPPGMNYSAVLRNGDGTIRSNANVEITFRIIRHAGLEDETVYEESHSKTTDAGGRLNHVIGMNAEFEQLNWMNEHYALEVLVDNVSFGKSDILSFPYAFAARDVINNEDADADPENEIQDLQLTEEGLVLTKVQNGTPIILQFSGEAYWIVDGDSVTVTEKNIGIGTQSAGGRLVIMGNSNDDAQTPIFEVKKSDGQKLFSVYNDGAELYINDTPVEGSRAGFAIGGYSTSKALGKEYFWVSGDSVRININENIGVKGTKGGFAIGGYNSSKEGSGNFAYLSPDNYFIGHESGTAITSGLNNTALGFQAGNKLTTGSENIFIGFLSGDSTNTGDQNIFLGTWSGVHNTSGYQNIFVGHSSGLLNTVGHHNLFLGRGSGQRNVEGSYNLFVGRFTGNSNSSGHDNTFIGSNAGVYNETGSNNMFVGNVAGEKNVDGNRNLFMGSFAGNSNVSGSDNLSFGRYAGGVLTTGTDNIFLGFSAGGTQTGQNNIYLGNLTGASNPDGSENIIIGAEAASSSTAGNQNIMLGTYVGDQANGDNNIYIGKQAGEKTTGTGNIFIGRFLFDIFQEDHALVIDYANHFDEESYIYGKFHEPVNNEFLRFNTRMGLGREPLDNSRLQVEGEASKSSAGDWLANSDYRIKSEIRDIENASDIMLKLRPVGFRYTEEYLEGHPTIEDREYYNFLAQEYEEVFPEAVMSSGEILESSGDDILQMDSYNSRIVSIAALQELIEENKRQKERIRELYRQIEDLVSEQ